MNHKVFTYLFLSSLAMNSCVAADTLSQLQPQSSSEVPQQLQEQDLSIFVNVIQDLLKQGYSVEQIVTLLENKSSDTAIEEDNLWKWVAVGVGAAVLGIALGWVLSKAVYDVHGQEARQIDLNQRAADLDEWIRQAQGIGGGTRESYLYLLRRHWIDRAMRGENSPSFHAEWDAIFRV